jgi:sortase (surface protein transpeptidase)
MTNTEVAEAGKTAGGVSPADPQAPGPQEEPAGAQPAAAQPADRGAPLSDDMPRLILHATGVGFVLLAVFVLGFAAYLYALSGVQENRSQTLLYTKLQNELAGQVGPLGPTTPGAPVAILNIPAIGVRDMVVVQGTSPQDMMAGPGHRPDTPLPGQAGVAQIYGRVATFGAPFARLAELLPGDVIHTTTQQGESTYTVAAIADSSHIIKDPEPDRLLLLTASSSAVPSYYIEVDARLATAVHSGAPVARVIDSSELPLANDQSVLPIALVWAIALALVAAGGTVAALRWSPWVAYLVAVPVALAVLWNLYQTLAALLPNLY